MAYCWTGFVRCISNRTDEPERARYRTATVENIKFENLLTLEEREKAERSPVVTETEIQYVRDGRLDRLAEEQMRKDMEADEELRREEERLRREEVAYYASKREAALKTKRATSSTTTTTATNRPNTGSSLITAQPKSTSSKKLMIDVEDEEEEFELFLKSVQAKTVTQPPPATNTAGISPQTPPRSLHSITSDNEGSEEEEIDFGYWEKASVPKKEEGTRTDTGNLRELDLDLL
ncbi:PREDICTED: uncharacterized protein LOC100639932 [Amphimedon queenslandica]|nr:PREDICTED: uncharacterized protein LOC100639932 [Amphimedon queenslandica]|eukprot:XP_003382480.1 PREDICTED: uncharacterized protein LOC100639932 [Amphimedon queenslandica]